MITDCNSGTSIASVVRQLVPDWALPPHVSAYRSAFLDLDDLAHTISSWSDFGSIIEVGCGEGFLSARLISVTQSNLIGIDVASSPGAGYFGPEERAEFRRVSAEVLFAERVSADLVVISDVVHHVPVEGSLAFLRSCAQLLNPGGLLVIKDWERRRNLFRLLSMISDRYLSGDKDVDFLSRDELVELVVQLPNVNLCFEERVRPHRNNIVLGFRKFE